MGENQWTQFYGYGLPRAELALARCIYGAEALRPKNYEDVPEMTTGIKKAYDDLNETWSETELPRSESQFTAFSLKDWETPTVEYRYLCVRLAYRVSNFTQDKLRFEYTTGGGWEPIKSWFTPENDITHVESMDLPSDVDFASLKFRVLADPHNEFYPAGQLKVFEVWTEGTAGADELELLYPTESSGPDSYAEHLERAHDGRTQSFAKIEVPQGGILPVEEIGIVLESWQRPNGLYDAAEQSGLFVSFAAEAFDVHQIGWEYSTDGVQWTPLEDEVKGSLFTPADGRYLLSYQLPVAYSDVGDLQIRLRMLCGEQAETAYVYVFETWVEGLHKEIMEFFSPTAFDDHGGATQDGGSAMDTLAETYASATVLTNETKVNRSGIAGDRIN